MVGENVGDVNINGDEPLPLAQKRPKAIPYFREHTEYAS
jgi:hypothetical protein